MLGIAALAPTYGLKDGIVQAALRSEKGIYILALWTSPIFGEVSRQAFQTRVNPSGTEETGWQPSIT